MTYYYSRTMLTARETIIDLELNINIKVVSWYSPAF